MPECLVYHLIYRVDRGNIASHWECADFLGERLQFVKRAGSNNQSRAIGGEELGGGLADAGTRAGCKIYRLNFGETWLSVVQRSLDIEGVCWMGRFLGRVIQRTLLV